MLILRCQQTGRAIHIGTVSTILGESCMTSTRRIDSGRFVIQYSGDVVWIVQPNDVLTGDHGFTYDRPILFVLVLSGLMQGIEAVFPWKDLNE